MERFEEVVRPMFDEMANLVYRNTVLREARDLLLSRLISGEVLVEGLLLPGED